MEQRSCLTRTLNLCWHQGFWILPLYRELLNSASRNRPSAASERARVALAWSSLSVRKTRSREERESFMRERRAPKIGQGSPSGLGRAAWSIRYMCGFGQAGRQWLPRGCLGCRLPQGSSLTILSMGSLQEGFPKIPPKACLAPIRARGCWSQWENDRDGEQWSVFFFETGMMLDHHLPLLRTIWSHFEHLFAGFAITSWRRTERPEDFFMKASVSPSFLGVFLWCFGFVFGWICFCLLGRHQAFCFHLFSNMWE